MPASPSPDIVARGASTSDDPATALRAALAAAGKALAAQGGSPADFTTMTWSSRTPAAIHPSRRLIDLSYREVFGGLRPVVTVIAAGHPGVEVEIRALPPSPPSATPVWNGFNAGDLARQYSPRTTVPDMQPIFDAWRADGARYRARHLIAEVAYGAGADETIDLYLPDTNGPHPLWVFIHGGYWQATDKDQHAQFAEGMRTAGYAVGMLNYALAPQMPLSGIVRQTQAAIAFLAREATALGCDPAKIHLSGHSAGGHLAAMIAALPEGKLIRSCLPLSGVFDVRPLTFMPMGAVLGIKSNADVAALSPQQFRPQPHVRMGVAVGGGESQEFQRQSADFAKAWGNASCRIIAAKNHFDLLDGLNGGELLDFAKEIASAAD